MGRDTAIDWCDSTVNPLMGCDGCELSSRDGRDGHCYAEGFVNLYAGMSGWPARFNRPELISADRRIAEACRWPDLTGQKRPFKTWLDRMPRMIFLCDLSDPFTESIEPLWLAPHIGRIAATPHIWLLLTKRPERLKLLVEHCLAQRWGWPANIWAGVSVTTQDTAKRIWTLLETPALPCRFVSIEPCLGLLSLRDFTEEQCSDCCGAEERGISCGMCGGTGFFYRDHEDGGIDWVIAGGESGKNARPAHPRWMQFLQNQCAAANVPFFFKQWGEWAPIDEPWKQDSPQPLAENERWLNLAGGHGFHGELVWRMRKVGKRRAGRLLDGREHLEVPAIVPSPQPQSSNP